MRLLSTLLVLVFAAMAGFSKNIKGTIHDEKGQPLPYVNVVLMKDTAFVDGRVSDERGAFLFENASTAADQIKISMIGYEVLVMPVPADGDLKTITLSPSSVMLGEVVVNGSRPITRIEGNSMVTNVANSILASAGSANDVLKNVPMLTGDNGSFSVFGRGAAVIYINGRLVRNAAEVSQLASTDIKEVQVISNPGAQYGAEVNAVIRIITKKPQGEGFSIAAYTDNTYNGWLTTAEQLDLKYRTGGLEIFGLGYFSHGKNRHEEYGNHTTHANTQLSEISSISTTATQTAITGKIGVNYQFNDKHSIGAYYQNDYSRKHSYGHLTSDIADNGTLSESSSSDLEAWAKYLPCHSANVYYNGTVGKFTFDVNGDYMQTKDSDRSYQYEQNLMSANRNVTTFSTTRNRLFAEKIAVSYELPKGNVMLGEEYTSSRSRNDFDNPEAILASEETDVRENNIGIFAQINQTFGKFSASAGLRYEHVKSEYYLDNALVSGQSKTYDNFFPSASVSYSPGDFRFSAAYSHRTMRPTYSNLNGNYYYVSSTTYTRGNPYLVPSKRQDFTLQAGWKYINLSAQYSYTKDAIVQIYEPYDDSGRINVFTLTNMPAHKVLSLFVNASPQFGIYHPSLSVGMDKQWFGIDYLGEYKKMGSPMYVIQLNNTLILPNDWNIEALIWWRSRADWKNWAYTHTYSTVNLRVYKKFLNKSLTVYLGVNDIFNGMIYKADLYSGNVMMRNSINNHSRNVKLTVRYNFNVSKSRYKGAGAGNAEKRRF